MYVSREAFLTLQNPLHKVHCFQISHLSRTNINTPIKGKKLFHLVIQLLSLETELSNLKEKDENSVNIVNFDNTNASKTKYKELKSNKSLTKVSNSEKLEEIYAELLEHSMNEDVGKGVCYTVLILF